MASTGNKVDDKIYCIHYHKKFAFHESNLLLMYHLQHKHLLQDIVDSDQQKSSHLQLISIVMSDKQASKQ